MIHDLPDFSHRSDPSIPRFEDGGLCAVMDAHCALCAKGARWIARHDTHEQFKIIPLQGVLGRALMLHYGMDPDDPISWLYLEEGRAYTSMDAMIRVGGKLGGVWRGFYVLRLLPRRVQDVIYTFIARNRYRFGRVASFCEMPDPEVKKRLIE